MTVYTEEYPDHIVCTMNTIRSELEVQNAQPLESYTRLSELRNKFTRSMDLVCRNWVTDP